MGTRSLTYIYEQSETEPFTCIYNQVDGYIEGLGQTIANFINSKTLVNGIPFGMKNQFMNGMGCLAAQLLVHMKEGREEAGSTYIYPAKLNQNAWQDYEYHIWPDMVKVTGGTAFEGTWQEFKSFCDNYGNEDNDT